MSAAAPDPRAAHGAARGEPADGAAQRRLRDEAVALASDEDDCAEAARVLREMEPLRPW